MPPLLLSCSCVDCALNYCLLCYWCSENSSNSGGALYVRYLDVVGVSTVEIEPTNSSVERAIRYAVADCDTNYCVERAADFSHAEHLKRVGFDDVDASMLSFAFINSSFIGNSASNGGGLFVSRSRMSLCADVCLELVSE
jgi:hypothetical protein